MLAWADMQAVPLLYLKNGEAQCPQGSPPPRWFDKDPMLLVQSWQKLGVATILVHDLNIPPTGKSPNLETVATLQKQTGVVPILTGNFRSVSAMEPYLRTGIHSVLLGATAYQIPNLLKDCCGAFPQKIAVQIEMKQGKVAIPGWIAPSHKTALAYAEQFQAAGVFAIAYSDVETLGPFCQQVPLSIWAQTEPQNLQDLEKVGSLTVNRPQYLILGKSHYEGKVDLHTTITFLNDLDIRFSQEETLMSEE